MVDVTTSRLLVESLKTAVQMARFRLPAIQTAIHMIQMAIQTPIPKHSEIDKIRETMESLKCSAIDS